MIVYLVSAAAFSFFAVLIGLRPESFWFINHAGSISIYLILPVIWMIYAGFMGRIKIQKSMNFYSGRKTHTAIFTLLLALLCANLFYIFRMERFLPPPYGNGDSLHLIEYVPVHTALFGYLASFDEILDLFVHSVFYSYVNRNFLITTETSYAILSSVCGGIYVIFFLRFVKNSNRGKFYAFALIFLTPALQLYAGYLENYTFVSLLLSVLFFESSQILESSSALTNKKLFFISALSAFAFLFHIVAGIILPALIYLVWKKSTSLTNFINLSIRAAAAALGIILFVWALFFLFMEYPVSPAESFLLNPPFLRPAAVLSFKHLADTLNTLFMASPFSVFILIYIFLSGEKYTVQKFSLANSEKKIPLIENFYSLFAPEPVHRFLLIGTLSFFGLMFIHNPMIGFPADWDLHTIFNIPLNLYLYFLITQDTSQKFVNERRLLLTSALLINAYFTFSWIYYNSKPDHLTRGFLLSAKLNTERTLRTLENDSLYNRLGSPQTKRKYAEVTQFYIKTRRILEVEKSLRLKQNKNIEKLDQMISDLDTGILEFRKLILLDQDSQKEKIPDLWKRLGRINADSAEMEKLQIRNYYGWIPTTSIE